MGEGAGPVKSGGDSDSEGAGQGTRLDRHCTALGLAVAQAVTCAAATRPCSAASAP